MVGACRRGGFFKSARSHRQYLAAVLAAIERGRVRRASRGKSYRARMPEGIRLQIEVIGRVLQQKVSPLHVGVRDFKLWLQLMVGARDRVESPLVAQPLEHIL